MWNAPNKLKSVFSRLLFISVAALCIYLPTSYLAKEAQAVPAQVYVVPNVATLRAGTYSTYPNLRLSGWYAAGDGGEGELVAMPSDTTSADNSCTIYVDAAGTRFYRLMQDNFRNQINFYQCGAHGDGTTSDTAALQAAVAAAGKVGVPNGGTYGRVFCPAGVFLTSGLVISPGQRIELVGQHVSGVSGCQIKASSTSIDVLSVFADVFRMEDVWLYGGNAAGSGNCLVLGSASQLINDTTISNSWISNCSNAGISIVNGQGIFINNTTIEISYTYGIASNLTGSNIAQNVTINGSTFYANVTALNIIGLGTGTAAQASNWNITAGTSFENNASASTCSINFQQANAINISGNRFRQGANHDICATSASNMSVVGNNWTKSYGAALICSQCSSVIFNNNNGSDMWLGYSVGFANSAIVSFTGAGSNNIVMGNSFLCTSPHALYGLSVASATTGTGVGPNLFGCETTTGYNVLGTKAWNY